MPLYPGESYSDKSIYCRDTDGNLGGAGFLDTVLSGLGSIKLQIASKAYDYTDFTAAAVSEAIDFDAALPANAVVLGAWIDVTTLFDSANTTSATASLGANGGTATSWVNALNVWADTGSTGAQGKSGPYTDTGDAETPTLTLTIDTDNVSALTQGACTAYVVYAVLS